MSKYAADFLNPRGNYYNDWTGGGMGNEAGDVAIDDISDPTNFDPTVLADDGLPDLSIEDPIGFDGVPSIPVIDPLVLNLAGGPVATTAASANGVTFDMRGDGSTQSTGWVTPDEGFLVIDTEQTRQITSSHDLISDLNELASFDSNGDGKITAADSGFSDLRVWIPGSQGGAGVLETLAQAGISEIDLASTRVNQADNGNTINSMFSYIRTDGTTGQGADVSFAVGSDIPPPTSNQSSGTGIDALVQAMAAFNPPAPAAMPPAYQLSRLPEVSLAAAH